MLGAPGAVLTHGARIMMGPGFGEAVGAMALRAMLVLLAVTLVVGIGVGIGAAFLIGW